MTQEYVDSLDSTLESLAQKLENADPADPETEKLIKSLKEVNDIRTSVYSLQQEAYEFDVKSDADAEKAAREKKDNLIVHIMNGATIIVTAVGSVVIPMKILKNNVTGDFWDKMALGASQKLPKLNPIRLFRK